MTRRESPPGAPAPRGLFCPQKPPLTEGKVSTGVRVMSYFGGNSLSQNLTVLPAPSWREPEAPSPRGLPPVRRLGSWRAQSSAASSRLPSFLACSTTAGTSISGRIS